MGFFTIDGRETRRSSIPHLTDAMPPGDICFNEVLLLHEEKIGTLISRVFDLAVKKALLTVQEGLPIESAEWARMRALGAHFLTN